MGTTPKAGFFQWDLDVAARFEEERHGNEWVTHGDGLNMSPHEGTRLIRGQGERLVGGSFVRISGDLIPDRAMDALGIAPRRSLEIENQQMDLMSQELGGLADEVIEGLAA